jgi:hypothetical protein
MMPLVMPSDGKRGYKIIQSKSNFRCSLDPMRRWFFYHKEDSFFVASESYLIVSTNFFKSHFNPAKFLVIFNPPALNSFN